MKRILSFTAILAFFLLSSPVLQAENIVTYSQPNNPVAKEALEIIQNDYMLKYSSDGMYTSRLLSTINRPVTLDELVNYTKVRSIQLKEYGLEMYDYFNCSFAWEESTMRFRKTGGSQRKAGVLTKSSNTEINFAGYWFYGGDKELDDAEHKEEGKLYKLSDNKIVMYFKRNDTIEIYEFTRPDAAANLTVTDSKGYVYSFRINQDGYEELAVERGGKYAGAVVIPQELEIDGKSITVSTIGEGAMWKGEDNPGVGNITSISLPSTVYKVEPDAFRDNAGLKKIEYGEFTTIESRAFFGCKSLKTGGIAPAFAFTSPGIETEDIHNVTMPLEQADEKLEKYNWAFFKDRHAGIYFNRWKSMDIENAMECWCPNINYVKGASYDFIDNVDMKQFFRGYIDEGSHEMLLLDNAYVGTHDLPAFSRWIFDEQTKSMNESFVSHMAQAYGREVDYSYEVGKLSSTGSQLAITEFAKTSSEAKAVLSWVSNGEEVCSYVMTSKFEGSDGTYSVWNVDDDGNYGIPHILNLAFDENRNVELFLLHYAPESWTYMHLKQNGSRLELVDERVYYVYIDPQLEKVDASYTSVMNAWTGDSAPEYYALYDIDGDGTKELFLKSEDAAWESVLTIKDGRCEEIAGYVTEAPMQFQFGSRGYIYLWDDNNMDCEITAFKLKNSAVSEVFSKVMDYDEKNTIHGFVKDMKSDEFKAVKFDTIKKNFTEDPVPEYMFLIDRWNIIDEFTFNNE